MGQVAHTRAALEIQELQLGMHHLQRVVQGQEGQGIPNLLALKQRLKVSTFVAHIFVVGSPPYKAALLGPLYTVVLGHQDNGAWVDLWQFVIEPLPDGASRLVLRTRTNMTGGIWSIIHPGVFIMERGMLLGIQHRAEAMAGQ